MERDKKAELRRFLNRAEKRTPSSKEKEAPPADNPLNEWKKNQKRAPLSEAEESFRQLKVLFEAASDGKVSLEVDCSNSRPGYHETRAVRFAYCVLGWPVNKIASAMGRNQRTVSRLVLSRRFNELRARIDEKLISDAVGKMEADVEAVTSLTTTALKRYLTQVIKTDQDLSVKDAKLISDIGANFHRILQLIKNKPTAIHGTLTAMSEEATFEAFVGVVRRMKEDPMFDMDKFLSEVGLTKDELKQAIVAEGGSVDDFDA